MSGVWVWTMSNISEDQNLLPQPIGMPLPVPLEEIAVELNEDSPAIDFLILRAKEVAVRIGGRDYFNVHELACALRIPGDAILRDVRKEVLPGRKVGKAYIITADDFYRYIRSDHFTYTPRNRACKADLETLEGQQDSFQAWLRRLDMR